MRSRTPITATLALAGLLLLSACTGGFSSMNVALAFDRFGINDSSPRKWISYGELGWQYLEKDVAEMERAGVQWVRMEIRWNSGNGGDYSQVDRLVKLYEDHGIKILGLLNGGDKLPDDLNAYRAWVEAIVRRYPSIRVWEIQNEPNLLPYWTASAQDYVTLLQAAYDTIKRVNPSLKVMLGGLSEWKAEEFIEQLIALKAWQWCDIFGYHPYGNDPDQVIVRLRSARRVMRGSPFYDMPIWITEIGFCTALTWNVPGKVATEEIKASYLKEIYQRLSQEPNVTGPIFWYTFQEEGDTMGFGLMNRRVRAFGIEEVEYSAAFSAYQDLALRESD